MSVHSSSETSWVRIASSVRTSTACHLKDKRAHRHVRTLEAMRTQGCSIRKAQSQTHIPGFHQIVQLEQAIAGARVSIGVTDEELPLEFLPARLLVAEAIRPLRVAFDRAVVGDARQITCPDGRK